jgi:hypothetical protein
MKLRYIQNRLAADRIIIAKITQENTILKFVVSFFSAISDKESDSIIFRVLIELR